MPVLRFMENVPKCKEKWIKLYSQDQDYVYDSMQFDDSLTSLHWLQDYSILSASLESLIGSSCQQSHLQGTASPSSPSAGEIAASWMSQSLGSPISCSASANRNDRSFLHQHKEDEHTVLAVAHEEIDVTNLQVKPPHSYATLICMAMQASNTNKITLSAIYNWITENFVYYRHAEPNWQNSIRHNLSLNKCFMKVSRQKDEPGKGGFWQIDPQCTDMFVNGVFKRRRTPATHFNRRGQREVITASKSLHNPDTQRYQHCHQAMYRMSHRENKNQQPRVKCETKWSAFAESALLAADSRDTEAPRGELDWALVFDDVLYGSGSNSVDVDLNQSLNSLGCEGESSQRGQHLGKWCSVRAQHACRYMEVSDKAAHSVEEIRDPQLLPPGHPTSYGELTPFSDLQGHPWEERKEEVQAVPLTLAHTLNLSEGFYLEMQPVTCDSLE